MTLHDAIVQVLVDAGRPLTTSQIADRINAGGLYTKRDGTSVSRLQVHGRTRNYPHLFDRNGSSVSLSGKDRAAEDEATSAGVASLASPTRRETEAVQDAVPTTLELDLLKPESFRLAGTIDRDVPDRPGLYAIRVRDRDVLPEPFRGHSEERGHDLLYLGIASQSLNRRFLGQELRARGHGTFFRSLGAILGYRPTAGSLVAKGNTRNYKFAPSDNAAIIEWMNSNLLVNWVEFAGAHAVEESALIKTRLPLLNLQGNPLALPELSALRAECVRIANLTAI